MPIQEKTFQLTLASASPRRKELFCALNIPFKILDVSFEENCLNSLSPEAYVKEIIRSKLAQASKNPDLKKDSFLVVADTIVCEKSRVFGKPKNVDQAKEFLQSLENTDHWVFTAVGMSCDLNGEKKEHLFVEKTRVRFSSFDSFLLEKYLDSGDWCDKAGAYGIQGDAGVFVSTIDGCYFNVVGFPLNGFIRELKDWLQALGHDGPWHKVFK